MEEELKEDADINEVIEWWQDNELVAELERRSADLISGKDKGISWAEFKKGLPKEKSKCELK